MGFYAISTLPIIESLQNTNLYDSEVDKVTQAWFADDSSAAGNLSGIFKWWNKLSEIGPQFGYFPNPSKCVLIVKDEDMKLKAKKIFQRQGIEITTKGKRHLGAVVGSQEFKKEYLEEKVNSWIEDVKLSSPMDCHLNVVGRFEFSMILRATPSVVFNRFHQGHPWR